MPEPGLPLVTVIAANLIMAVASAMLVAGLLVAARLAGLISPSRVRVAILGISASSAFLLLLR